MSSEEVELSELTAVSPLDGRYWRVTRALSAHCSELALVRARVRVEIEYFLALARSAAVRSAVPALAAFDVAAHEPALRALYADFDAAACARVKALERATNHDVKAVEYYLVHRHGWQSTTAIGWQSTICIGCQSTIFIGCQSTIFIGWQSTIFIGWQSTHTFHLGAGSPPGA